MNIIELRDIFKIYHPGAVDVPALNGVSLTIKQGEFVAIMGSSGSGKSTLLHILGLLDRPSTGSYILAGQEVSSLNDDKLATLRNNLMGFIFQSFNLLPRVSAQTNVLLPLVYSNNNGIQKEGRDILAIGLLKKVGLADRIQHKPNELSGGQQQRVAIARALINNPRILFADEPTGNLDTRSTKEILSLLTALNESGITIVMVTHEDDIAEQAKRIIRLQDGKVISDVRKKSSEAPVLENNVIISIETLAHSLMTLKRIKDYFYQALRSLLTNKSRSFLSILGVLIGVSSLIAMLALGTGAKESIKARISSLGSNILSVRPAHRTHGVMNQANVALRLTIEDAYAVKSRISGINKVAPYVNGSAQIVYGSNNWNTSIEGTTSDYPSLKSIVLSEGRFFTEAETVRREKVAVIGKTVSTKLFGEQTPIGAFIKINRINFRVIGVLPEKGASGFRDEDDRVIVPLNTAMYRLFGKEFVSNIDVQVADETMMEDVSQKIKNLIAMRHRFTGDPGTAVDVRNLAEIQETITATVNTFAYLLGSIAFVSLLVGGIGIMNIMLVTVTERTREIGLRKAIGASSKDILSQFIIEAVVICVLGGVIGILFGSFISIVLAKFAGWITKISFFSISLAFLFSLGVGLLFGIWPAFKASRLDPIDALRYE